MSHNRNRSSPWWIKLFAAVGMITTGIGLARILVHFGREGGEPTSSEVPKAGTDEFLQALSETLVNPIVRGGTVQVLNNGDEFFPALLDAIEKAEHHVHIMTYIWKKSQISEKILKLLIRRAREGIEVRVMLDGLGSQFAPWSELEKLREAGGQVVVFSPPLSSRILYLNKRNHRRAFVIDGRIGFTGGMAISDEWTGNAGSPENWRDTMVVVTGPLAHTLQGAFMQLWVNVRGEQLFGQKYFPVFEDSSDSDLAQIGVAHSPAGVIQPLLHFYWFTLKSAQKRIYIANAYFAPDENILNVLLEKARAGLDVRLLLPGPHMDRNMVRWSARRGYQELLEAGIRIYEFQPTMIHAKHMLVDDIWTVYGSADLGYRSIKLNHENVLGIRGKDIAGETLEVFEQDFSRSKEIKLEAWNNRPWSERMLELMAVGLKAQY